MTTYLTPLETSEAVGVWVSLVLLVLMGVVLVCGGVWLITR